MERKIILASASPRRRELMLQLGLPYNVQVSDVEEVITESEPARVVEELSRQKAAAVATAMETGKLNRCKTTVGSTGDGALGQETAAGTAGVGVLGQESTAGTDGDGALGQESTAGTFGDGALGQETAAGTAGTDMTGQESEGKYVVIGADTVVACDGEILGKPKDREDARRMLRMLQGRTHQVYTGVTLCTGDLGMKTFHEATEVTFYPMTEDEIETYLATEDLVNPKNEDGSPRYEWADKAGAYAVQGASSKYIQKIQGDYFNVVGLPVARLYHELIAMQL